MFKERPIRRSQLITPFGVGSIVDFRGPEALMTAGLDAWPKAKSTQEDCVDLVILEERLQARLNKTHFRLPPAFDEKKDDPDQLIPFVRFPCWHYCPDCFVMREMHLNEMRARCQSERCLKKKSEYKRAWLMPVRILTVCEHGHIDDFPFYEWVHGGNRPQDLSPHILSWRATGTSSSLAGITIGCSCGTSRTLQGAFTFSGTDGGAMRNELNMDCSGRRPWLGEQGTPNGCGEFLRVVQRGATNVYFPVIRSSIYLPSSVNDQDDWLVQYVDKLMRKIAEKGVGELEKTVRAMAYIDNLSEEMLFSAVNQRLSRDRARANAGVMSDEEFRHEEFQVLTGDSLEPGKELKLREHRISQYGQMQKYFNRIRLVTKLRETRVLESFTRISPLENGQSRPQELALDPALGWLPAIIVRGEGIFFEFKDNLLSTWEENVSQRAIEFRDQYETSVRRQDRTSERISARFVLLHTFAHLMIRELTYECGYGTAALRERIYCDILGPVMNGVLIYTASGDSEGTLGGLVRQGQPDRLIRCFRSALNKAIWCSGDPVCIESPGQGTNNSNLAACHGCSLLPETCCEQGNMLLDRALLIGKPDERGLAFFV